jgi:Flp pilus assembly protein TadG
MPCFRTDARGNVAMVFALAAIPIVGIAGIAMDYSRATDARAQLQAISDGLALHVANSENRNDFDQVISTYLAEKAERDPNAAHLQLITAEAEWINPSTFSLELSGDVRTVMAHAVPGIARAMNVSVRTDVHIDGVTQQYEPPEMTYLDPDAGDYNQLFAYCFDYESAAVDNPHGRDQFRSQMTLIADNEGTDYDFDWPRCGEGESLSFKMRNQRHVRSHPELLNNPNRPPYAPVFEYFTDTRIVNGREIFDIIRVAQDIPGAWNQWFREGQVDQGFEMLETVRCDTLDECVGRSAGGIIPEGKNRTPQIEDRGCTPGSYMYFGWEDRPPGQPGPNHNWLQPGWTDRSYDDIRIVMKCPDSGEVGTRNVRIIR